MWDEDITDEKSVRWKDPKNAEIFGSDAGPFPVVRVREDECAPVCTCSGRGGGLLDDGHSPRCEIRAKKVMGTFVTVLMNGRHRSFPEELFEVAPRPWRK